MDDLTSLLSQGVSDNTASPAPSPGAPPDPALQQLLDIPAANPEPATNTPHGPQGSLEEVLAAGPKHKSANALADIDMVPAAHLKRKDKLDYVGRYTQGPYVNIAGLKDYALDALYNTCKFAERDGLTPTIGSANDSHQGKSSAHNWGEAVDMSFKRKDDYLSDREMVEVGKRLGSMAGWKQMRDEWTPGLNGNTYSNAHLHFNYFDGAGSSKDPAVTNFRQRDRKDPESTSWTPDGEAYQQKAINAASPKSSHSSEYHANNLPGMAHNIALSEGVDPNVFSRLVGAESAYNMNAISNAGARGLCQMMPATAAAQCKKLGLDPSAMSNPIVQLRAGANYLKECVDSFGGDIAQGLAAYNAGPAAVASMIAGKIKPYRETVDYVYKILHPLDPHIHTPEQASAAIVSGGTLKNPNGLAESTAAQVHNETTGLAARLLSRFTGFSNPSIAGQFHDLYKEMFHQYSDPTNPNSFNYSGNNARSLAQGLLGVARGTDPGDYAKGALIQLGDFAQDIVAGLASAIPGVGSIPMRSERNIASSEYLDSQTGVLGKTLGLMSSHAGQGVGFVAGFEFALQKLLGSAGGILGGTKVALGADAAAGSAALLDTFQAGRAFKNLIAPAALAGFQDFQSNMAEYLSGHGPFSGKTAKEAAGYSLYNGALTSLSSIALMGFGTLGGGMLKASIEGSSTAWGKALQTMMSATTSPVAAAAMGSVMAGGMGGAAAALGNISGLNQKMFGQNLDVSGAIADSAIAAVPATIGGRALASFAPSRRLAGTAWGKFESACHSVAQNAFGAHQGSVDAAVKAGLESLSRVTNAQSLSAANEALLSIQRHTDTMEQAHAQAKQQVDFYDKKAQQAKQQADLFNGQAQTLSMDPHVESYIQANETLKLSAEALEAEKQKFEEAVKSGGDTDKASRSLNQSLLKHKDMEAMVAKMTTAPESKDAIFKYRQAVKQGAEAMQEQQKAMGLFQSVKQDYDRRAIGTSHMIDMCKYQRDVLQRAAEELSLVDPTKGDRAADFENKLIEGVNASIRQDVPWLRDIDKIAGMEAFSGPEGEKLQRRLYGTFQEAFKDSIMQHIRRQSAMPTELDKLTSQIIGAFTPYSEKDQTIKPTRGVASMARFPVEQFVALKDKFDSIRRFGGGKEMVTAGASLRKGLADADAALFSGLPLPYDPGSVRSSRGVLRYLHLDGLEPLIHMAEAHGLIDPTSPDTILQDAAALRKIRVPQINNISDFLHSIADIKAAIVSGQNVMPFMYNKKGLEASKPSLTLKSFGERIAPLELHVNAMRKTAETYGKMTRSAMMGEKDLSMSFHPLQFLKNSHAMMDFTNPIADALKQPDLGKSKQQIEQVLATDDKAFSLALSDILFTNKELIMFGDPNGQKMTGDAIMSSSSNNIAENIVGRDPLLNHLLEKFNAREGPNVGMVDHAYRQTGREEIHMGDRPNSAKKNALEKGNKENLQDMSAELLLQDRRYRTAGDARGIGLLLFGRDYHSRNIAMADAMTPIFERFEQICKDASGEALSTAQAKNYNEWTGGHEGRMRSRKLFNEDLASAIEDPETRGEFERKWGSAGQKVMYYARELQSTLERMRLAHPDMDDYMRANYLYAYFPKAAAAHLDAHSSGVAATLSTTYSPEYIRGFGTRREFLRSIENSLQTLRALGIKPDQFRNYSVDERVNKIYADQMHGMTADKFRELAPQKYAKMAANCDRLAGAYLFDEVENDPVQLLKRQFHSFVKASSVRQLFHAFSNTAVDIGGGSAFPKMSELLTIMPAGEKHPPEVWYDAAGKKRKSYEALANIPGFTNFSTRYNGDTILSNRIFVHPEVVEFLRDNAITPMTNNYASKISQGWDEAKRLLRSSALCGGYHPHMLNNMWYRLSDFVLTPMRAMINDAAGKTFLNGGTRQYQLARFNAIRAGVNMRTFAEASSGVLQAMVDQMDPKVREEWMRVSDNSVLAFAQALDPTHASNKIAYSQLGGMKKHFADILGAPIQVDHIFMREAAHANIQAGMLGGFYYYKELFRQQHAEKLAEMSPMAQEDTLNAMASTLVNQKAAALPYYMTKSTFRNLVGSAFMSPSWATAKANLLADSLDGVVGWGTSGLKRAGINVGSPETADAFKALGVSRKFSGYAPEIRQAIRNRFVTCTAGALFSSIVGAQVFQHMISGGPTWGDGRDPSKFLSLKLADGRFVSGFTPGIIRDAIEWAVATKEKGAEGAINKAAQIFHKNLLPVFRATEQLVNGWDDNHLPIFQPNEGGIKGYARNTADLAGFMAKTLTNIDDGMGYKTNAQISEVLGNAHLNPTNLSPNSTTSKEYLLRVLGMFDSKDNWAISQSKNIQERQAEIRSLAGARIQHCLDAAKQLRQEGNAQEADQMFQMALNIFAQGEEVRDPALAKYLPNNRYHLSTKQLNDMIWRTFDPVSYMAHETSHGKSAGNLAALENIMQNPSVSGPSSSSEESSGEDSANINTSDDQ